MVFRGHFNPQVKFSGWNTAWEIGKGNNVYKVDFHNTYLTDKWLFQNRIPFVNSKFHYNKNYNKAL